MWITRRRNRLPAVLRSLGLLLFVFAAPLSEAAAQPAGVIEGRVLARGSRQALEGARVRLDADAAVTAADASGAFRFDAVTAGPHTVSVQVLGYETSRRNVTVVAGQVVTVVFELAVAPLPMPDVVVSAHREEVRRAEVPANVGVVRGEDVRDSKPHHPAEIFGRVPGVHVVDLGGEGHTVAMRQPITYNAVYAYLEDGVPIRSTGFFNHNALYEINIPASDRIEVFKGPATALYGSDAIGGVVNVMTRPPSAAPAFEVFAEGGRFGYGRALGTASDTWGAHGLRADLNVTHFDGWRDGASQDRRSGTIRHDWKLGEGARLKTVLTTSWIDSPGDGGSDVSRADFDDRSTVNYTPIAFRKVEAVRLSSAWQMQTGSWLFDVTGYARHNRLELLPSWQLTYDPQVWDTRNRSVGALLRARRNFVPARAAVIGGLDVDWSPGRRVIDEVLPSTTGDVFAAYTTGERQYDYDVTFRGVSPYVEASATLFERLHLSGGLREDWIGYDYDNRLTELATGSHRRPASTSVAFDHLTPSAGATWEFDPATNAFVSWRHAFRVPSEDQLFVQGSATRSLGLEPVRANSYEAGLRRSFGHRGRIEASAYRMDMKDDIVSFFNTTDFTSENSNAGRSRHWGVEAGFDLDLSPVRVEGSYSYNRHRYLEWLTSTGVDYGGNEMESGPRHLVNARVTGRLPRRSSLTAEWVSVGRYFTDPGNEHEYGGYDLINAFGHVGLTRELDLVARLNNAADVRYANTASFNPFVAPELRERFGPGLPRSFFLGVQYALGR